MANTQFAIAWVQAQMNAGGRVRPNGALREVPLVPPTITGLHIASPSEMTLVVRDSDDTIAVAPAFWERVWSLVAVCDEFPTMRHPYGLTWRHRWGSPTVIDSRHYVHPCTCRGMTRLKYLVTGR